VSGNSLRSFRRILSDGFKQKEKLSDQVVSIKEFRQALLWLGQLFFSHLERIIILLIFATVIASKSHCCTDSGSRQTNDLMLVVFLSFCGFKSRLTAFLSPTTETSVRHTWVQQSQQCIIHHRSKPSNKLQ